MSSAGGSSRGRAKAVDAYWGPLLRRSAYVTSIALVAWIVVYAMGWPPVTPLEAIGIAVVGALLVFYLTSAFQYNVVVPRRVRALSDQVDRHDLDLSMAELNTLLSDGRGDSDSKRRAIETLVEKIELAAQNAVAAGAEPADIESYLAIQLERSDASLEADPELLAPVLDLLERLRPDQAS